jgi:hypothetical protein
MRTRPLTTAALGALLLFAAARSSHAAWIIPEGVAGSSFWSYNQHPENTINGSGLSAESTAGTHDNNGGAATMWHSSQGYDQGGAAPVVDDQFLTFTLPGTYTLTDAHFWNMNQSGLTNRSINQYDLEVSADGVTWSTVLNNDTLSQAGGTATEPVQSRALAPMAPVRFVHIDIDTDHSGGTNNYVGLSEMRFEGTQTATGPTITTDYAATGPGLATPISSTDLLQGITATSNLGIAGGSGPIGKLTDGIGTSNFAHRVIGADSSGNWQVTFDLGLGAGMLAFIEELNLYTYNTDNRRILDLDVLISRDHQATWEHIFIGANNIPLGSGLVTLTSLADGSGDPITPRGMTDLRLTMRPVWMGVRHSSFIEVDAVGYITPEPGTMSLLTLGTLTMLARRRRRK